MYPERTMRKYLAIALISIVLVGCASKESKVMGTYNLTPKDKGAVTLDLKADHKWAITGGNSPAGTWKFEGEKLALKMETVMGKPVDEIMNQAKSLGAAQSQLDLFKKPLEGSVSEDFKTIIVTIPLAGPLTFTKAGA